MVPMVVGIPQSPTKIYIFVLFSILLVEMVQPRNFQTPFLQISLSCPQLGSNLQSELIMYNQDSMKYGLLWNLFTFQSVIYLTSLCVIDTYVCITHIHHLCCTYALTNTCFLPICVRGAGSWHTCSRRSFPTDRNFICQKGSLVGI